MTGVLTSSSLPSFITLPSLSFSTLSLFTYFQPGGLSTIQNWSLKQLSRQQPRPASFPDAKPHQTYSQVASVWAPSYLPAEQHLESTTRTATERAPMEEGTPEEANAIGDRSKTTETDAHSSLSSVYACTPVSRQNLSTNQIRPSRLPARAFPAGFKGVYKESPVVLKSFGQVLARVRLIVR